ncbi:hypothetical protein AAG570_008939 [Ranatra chinensis]|uniref:Uncharacterized protein n=1 Tax=Ranatra chinensis TaxID=642074 RepID=A0ABD0Z582_9HEMI
MIREFRRCPDAEKSFIRIVSSRVDMVGPGKRVVNAVFVLPKNIERFTKAALKIYKCPSFTDQADCESYLRMQSNENVCSRLLRENEIWTPLIQSFHPSFKCPLKMVCTNFIAIVNF